MYFFIARRLFCLLRLCEFFRASCFMLVLLVPRDIPAGCLRMRVLHGEGFFVDPQGDSVTLSPLAPLVSLWPLVPLVCRFYFGPDIRSAHARIPGKLYRERYGSQAGQFVSLSGPDKARMYKKIWFRWTVLQRRKRCYPTPRPLQPDSRPWWS